MNSLSSATVTIIIKQSRVRQAVRIDSIGCGRKLKFVSSFNPSTMFHFTRAARSGDQAFSWPPKIHFLMKNQKNICKEFALSLYNLALTL